MKKNIYIYYYINEGTNNFFFFFGESFYAQVLSKFFICPSVRSVPKMFVIV